MKIHSRKKPAPAPKPAPPKANWPFPVPSAGPSSPPPRNIFDDEDEEVLRKTVDGVDVTYIDFDEGDWFEVSGSKS